MHPKRSTIQKCFYCGRYSLLSKWKDTGEISIKLSGKTGNLTCAETKEAYNELSVLTKIASELCDISISFIHSYHDEFSRPRSRRAVLEKKEIVTLYLGIVELNLVYGLMFYFDDCQIAMSCYAEGWAP